MQKLCASQLIFEKSQWKKLQEIAEAGYPKEVCGLLLGKSNRDSVFKKTVIKIVPLSNLVDGNHSSRLKELLDWKALSLSKERLFSGGRTEFVMDPLELNQKLLQAFKEGFMDIGIFHSHPDHPPRPSFTDISQPYLAGWSNLIVSVEKKKFVGASSWIRDSEDASFQEEEIVVE